MTRRALSALALALTLGALPGVGATTAPTLTLEQQAKKAALIVRARLGSPASVTEGNVAYLVYPLTVTETIDGDATTLPKYQDKPALYFLQGLSDLPNMQADQDVFALLYTQKLDSPLVGFNQGLYLIKDGKVSRLLPANPNPQATLPQTTPQPSSTSPGTVTSPSTATPPASTPPADPSALGDALSDPAKFREALRAARGNK